MGTFVDRLRDYHGSTAQIPFDLGIDTPPAEPMQTSDVLCAVRLDAAGVNAAPGRVIAIYVDDAAKSHFRRFIDVIGLPDSRSSSYAEGMPPGGIVMHVGKLDSDKWQTGDWWSHAYQRGLGIVVLCSDAQDVSVYAEFVDDAYDLRGRYGTCAYDAISMVLGVAVSTIPDFVLIRRADFAALFSSVRPGASIEEVISRLQKASGYDVGAIERVLEGICDHSDKPSDKPRLRDLCGYGAAKDWGLQLAEDFQAYADGDIEWDDMDRGILLSGPPGCGKTYFANALAEECGVGLILMSYSEMESKTGSGNLIAKAIKKLFDDARNKAPCIVFIDEIDSIHSRSDRDHNSSWFTVVVNALLAELDGATPRPGVVVVGATNFPDRIDPALRRPGRLDRHVEIPRPSVDRH